MAKMKEQNKIQEKELNKTEITNLSDAELKTLVIRMLKELTEYSNSIKEEISIQPEQQEKRILKNEVSIRSLLYISKCANI